MKLTNIFNALYQLYYIFHKVTVTCIHETPSKTLRAIIIKILNNE